MKALRNWIIVSWIVGIAVLYYRYHLFYLEALGNHELWIGTALVALCVVIAAWFIRRRNGISLSFMTIAWWLLVLTTITAVIVSIMRGMTGEVSIVTLAVKTTSMLLALLVTLTIVFGICMSFGLLLLRKLRVTASSITLHGVALGLGILALQLFLFGLGLLGALNLLGVLGVLVGMLIISLTEAANLVQASYQKRLRLTWDWKSLPHYVCAAAIIVFIFNLLHLLRPIPNGWDEYVRYLNTPRILANTHELFTGFNAYPNELIMSIGFMLRDSLFIALGFSVIIGVLSAIGVYALARNFLSAKYSVLTASLWYLIPFIIFQSSREVKIDLAVAFFTITALCAVVTWFRDPAQHERTSQWLTIVGLLSGAAFVSKYTAIFFCVALAGAILYALFKLRRQIILPFIIFCVASSLAYLPWAAYFIASTQTITVDTLQHGTVIAPQASCIAPETTSNPDTGTVIPAPTGSEEELGRYLGYAAGIQRYLLLPWTMTMNPIVRGLNVDIGPLFLCLLPVLLWFLPLDPSRSRPILTLFTVIYWLLWVLLGKGVIWYGLPGFTSVILFLTWPLEGNRLPAMVRRVSLTLIAVTVTIITVFRIYGAIPPVQIAYLGGAITPTQYVDSVLPKYREIYELLNTVPSTEEAPNYIYRIGTFIPYFIRDNHRRLYTDDQMDMLTCIRAGRTDVETIAELKRQGFRFIVFDLNIPTIDQTENKTLTEKWKATADLINNNLRILGIEQEGRNKIVLAAIE